MLSALVTDTHPLVSYFCDGKRRLSKKVLQVFDRALIDGTQILYVPTVVLWELSMLLNKGAIKLNQPFEDWLSQLFSSPSLIEQQPDQETVLICHNLNFSPDPFDKMIVAASLQLGFPLITNDSVMHASMPCELFWD